MRPARPVWSSTPWVFDGGDAFPGRAPTERCERSEYQWVELRASLTCTFSSVGPQEGTFGVRRGTIRRGHPCGGGATWADGRASRLTGVNGPRPVHGFRFSSTTTR